MRNFLSQAFSLSSSQHSDVRSPTPRPFPLPARRGWSRNTMHSCIPPQSFDGDSYGMGKSATPPVERNEARLAQFRIAINAQAGHGRGRAMKMDVKTRGRKIPLKQFRLSAARGGARQGNAE